MINVVLVDDETNALEMLEWQLQRYCSDVKIAAMCLSVEEAIEAIEVHMPELIFLDIEMPGKNGFDLIRHFQQPAFDVIFTTAYNQFAIKAFKFSALDYLLKPIEAADLIDSLARYKERRSAKKQQEFNVLLKQWQGKNVVGKKIALNTGDGLQFFLPDEIIRCESASNYTYIFISGRPRIMLAKTLKEIEEVLLPYGFFRVHHSHLINLAHIDRFVRADGGGIFMSDGACIVPSRTKKEAFMELFQKL